MFEYPEDNPKERKKRAQKHAAWLKDNQAEQLHDRRVELVRQYLANPRQWPDGLDWPHWDKPHENWYTGHEAYWNPLALALQAEIDGKAKSPAPCEAARSSNRSRHRRGSQPTTREAKTCGHHPVHAPVHSVH